MTGGDEVGYRSRKSFWRKDSVDVENKVPYIEGFSWPRCYSWLWVQYNFCGGVSETRLVRSVTPLWDFPIKSRWREISRV